MAVGRLIGSATPVLAFADEGDASLVDQNRFGCTICSRFLLSYHGMLNLRMNLKR